MNRKKYFLFFLCFSVCAGGLFLIFSLPPPHTLVLAEDGFHPRTMTVSVGDTVTFRTKQNKYFWPASDFHPTHSLYPAFDANAPVSPDDSWSFTFTEPGVYPFHDHLAAYYFGIIQVQDTSGKVTDNCMEQGGKVQCWQNEIFFALAQGGVDGAYGAVAELFTTDPEFRESCHSIAHNIGLASYQFYAKNKDFIISPKAAVCAGGFYHGFMEGYIGATGDTTGAGRVCDDIGEAVGVVSPSARLQCYHGIGHGAVETTIASTGSFGSQYAFIESALALCEQASAGVDERYRCVSGVYNGIANFYINSAYGLSVEKENPLLLCATQKDIYKEACYGNMNSVVLWSADNNFTKAAASVLALPDNNHRARALWYLASLYATEHLSDTSFEEVVNECHHLQVEFRGDCIRGFAEGLLEHGNPGVEYKQMLTFCREPLLSNAERAECLNATLSTLESWYGKEKAKDICSSLEEDERTYCSP